MNEDRRIGDMAEDLRLLRPAGSGIDSRIVFYEAGFNAGKSQQTAHTRVRSVPLIAAGLLAAIVTAPASYRIGLVAAKQAKPESTIAVTHSDLIHEAVSSEGPGVDPAPRIETTNHSRRPELFASWIDPLQKLAETGNLERPSGTTLAAFHSSLVQPQNYVQNWREFPFPSTSSANGESFTSSLGTHVDSTSSQTLAVGDLRKLALSPEAMR